MEKNKKILGLLGLAARARKICFGTDSVIEQIQKRKVKLVVVSKDSSERTRKNILNSCNKYGVPIIYLGTVEENSKAIGKQNKAVIGVKESHLAKEIEKIYNRG